MKGAKRVLSVLLAFQLAWSSVPVQALEEALGADGEEPAAVEAAEVAASEDTVVDAAEEEVFEDTSVEAVAVPEPEATVEPESEAEPEVEPEPASEAELDSDPVPEAGPEVEPAPEPESTPEATVTGDATESEAAEPEASETAADAPVDGAPEVIVPESLGNEEIDRQVEADMQAYLQAQADGAQTEAFVGGTIPEHAPALSVHEGEDEDIEAQASLPSSYDSRAKGVITPVRDQDPFGICWSFATMAAAEASLLTQGIGGAASKLRLSERHLAYFAFHNQTDALGGTAGDQTLPLGSTYGHGMAKDPYLVSGGNLPMTAYTLASWMGAARSDAVGTYADLTQAYFYRDDDDQFLSQTALNASLARSVNAYRLANEKRIAFKDRADVKRAIMDHGAVATALLFDGLMSDSYNRQCSTLYNAQAENTSHIVSIVGWDDNFDPKYFGKDNGFALAGNADIPKTNGTLTLGKTITIPTSSSSGLKYYAFTPSKDGVYTFRVTSAQDYPPMFSVYVTANDGKAMWIQGCDSTETNCTSTCNLNAKTTYYVAMYGATDGCTLSVSYDKALGTFARPKSKGAWLCKNSWGEFSSATGGYFWLSYEEPSLFLDGVKAHVFDMRVAGDLDNIYQYDGSASEFYNIVESGGSVANVFRAAASAGESLREVGFALEDVNVNYSIQVYLNLSNSKVPTSGVPFFKKPVTGSTKYAGYYTVALPHAVPLHKGTDFAVVITLSHKNGREVWYNVDASGEDAWHRCVSAVTAGQSFEQDRKGAAWDDLASTNHDAPDEPRCAARIKAFTTTTPAGSVPKASVAYAAVSLKPTSKVYDGKGTHPALTVRYAGKTLKEGTDFVATTEGNASSVGKKTLIVRGKGAYMGTRKLTYRITFKDVASSHWGFSVVHRASDLGLVTGYGGAKAGTFGPNDPITRGQVAVILWRMAGMPAPRAGARSFSDVATGAYYYKAVRWASSVGVVSGYATGTFGPDDKVTREQLAAMLANYARRIGGIKTAGSRADYANMKDSAAVSGWAQTAVGWCFRNKILSGSQGNVNPQGNATRVQAAKMLVGLYDLVK